MFVSWPTRQGFLGLATCLQGIDHIFSAGVTACGCAFIFDAPKKKAAVHITIIYMRKFCSSIKQQREDQRVDAHNTRSYLFDSLTAYRM